MAANRKIATISDIETIEAEPLSSRLTHSSTYDVLRDAAQKWSSNPSVTFQLKGDLKSKAYDWSYTELLEETTRAANLFRRLGVEGSDTVALVLPNLPETVAAQIAGHTAGIVCPINPLLEPEQMASIMREADATVLVTLKSFPKIDIAQNVAEALTLAPKVKHVIEIDLRKYLTPPLSWIVPLLRPKLEVKHSAKIHDWDTATRMESGETLSFEMPEGGLDRIAAYMHTGGTTGDPKLAMHHMRGMLFIADSVSSSILEEGNSILCALPLFHCFGAYVMALTAPYAGARLVLMTPAGFRGEGVIDNFWKLVERYKINFFMGVPTALSALNQRALDANVSTLQYCICGSAPLPQELFREFEEKTGIRILEGYGQTEATVVCSVNPPEGERKIGSVGYRLPYTQIKAIEIKDDGGFGRFCDTDEIGELCISGPHVFSGYKDDHKNAKVFVMDLEGQKWLRSGDLGRIDSDQYYWITGRAKDLIIRGGHNIDPGEIEEAIMQHPAVAFVGAIGQPDAYSGELPCAYVELNDGMEVSAEEIKAFAAEHVGERAARPVHVTLMDELPKTAVGKVFKPELRQEAITRVLTEALEKAGAPGSVTVQKDKLKGLIAVIEPSDGISEEQIGDVLDKFAVGWRMHSAS